MLIGLAGAGCGDSPSVALPVGPGSSSATTTAAHGGSPAPAAYSGLGAPSAAFARAHRETARRRQPGEPLVDRVILDAAGRVTAYSIQFNDRPPLSDYERLVSAAGVSDLPRDRITLARTAGCLVYGSPGLKALIGTAYARVTTTPATTTASVQSALTPRC